MDQKNIIVKCKAHPDCLFNHNKVCDNYVINIGADGKCECYIETVSEEQIQNENYEFKGYSITKPNEPIQLKMTIAEFDKITKNKSTIKDVVPECDLPVCDWFCKHALKDGPSFNPYIWCDLYKMNPAMGLFCSLKEEEEK